MTVPTKVLNDSLGRIGSLKRTSDKSLFPMALGSCGHRITHQLRPINMNGRSILAVTSILEQARAHRGDLPRRVVLLRRRARTRRGRRLLVQGPKRRRDEGERLSHLAVRGGKRSGQSLGRARSCGGREPRPSPRYGREGFRRAPRRMLAERFARRTDPGACEADGCAVQIPAPDSVRICLAQNHIRQDQATRATRAGARSRGREMKPKAAFRSSHADRWTGGPETGTQLVIDSSCVPITAPRWWNNRCSPRGGATMARVWRQAAEWATLGCWAGGPGS